MVAGNASLPGEAVMFDTQTGQVVVDFSGTPYGGLAGAFTSDSRKLVLGSLDGPVFVIDVATLRSDGPVPAAIDLEIPAHDFPVIVVRVSSDGSRVATASFGGPLKVWDLTIDGQLLGEFGGESGNIADFHPTEPHIVVASPPNHVRVHTFDIDELIAIAQDRFTRPMTEAECEQYLRGPCAGS
jgi:WD40 repeat protein